MAVLNHRHRWGDQLTAVPPIWVLFLGALVSDDDGRSVLRGSVALDFRTTDRVVILNLPGQVQRLFKLRLAASPSHSDQFGPWHLADRVASPKRDEPARSEADDAFAIRYRVR
jgi:hypothetical protein